MNNKISVWLADDHQIVLDGLLLVLASEAQLEIKGCSKSGTELLKDLKLNAVDLLITDLKMPGMDGFEMIAEIKKLYPKLLILVVSMSSEISIVHKLFDLEIEGYILKNSGKLELLAAINNVINGAIHYESSLLQEILKRSRKNAAPAGDKPLSTREKQILNLIVNEKTSKEIADILCISKQTVDTHRLNIYEKTKTNNLVGLIKYAIHTNMD